jgi:hypothetical protein
VEIMLAAQFLTMERFVEQAMRSLSERAELCRSMVETAKQSADETHSQWEAAMREALDQTGPLRGLLTHAWIHPTGDRFVELPGL